MREFAITKERELELTGPVKALVMLVIVLYHACAIYGGVWFGEPATPCPALGVFVQRLSAIHMPLFLLVSGYIWAYRACGLFLVPTPHTLGQAGTRRV